MRTLIIYASPNKTGHCAQIQSEIRQRFDSEARPYEVLDLCSIKYDPVLQEDELYTIGNRTISNQNLKIQAMIKESRHIIFIYPVWWGSMPAILKGFFDRILTPGFAYQFSPQGIPQGLLKDKKVVVFMTSGSASAVTLLFNQKRSSALIRDDILKFCGMDANVFVVDKARKLDDAQKHKIKREVKKGLDWLYSSV